jgi:hypothetical protein
MRLLLSSILLLSSVALAAGAERDYSGKYELLPAHAWARKKGFELIVRQTGARATISFSAANVDGSGAAPDAEGKGQVKNGLLTFKFRDSFDNTGTGTLSLLRNGMFRLTMNPNKVRDSRALVHYGDLTLVPTEGREGNKRSQRDF